MRFEKLITNIIVLAPTRYVQFELLFKYQPSYVLRYYTYVWAF